MMNHDTESHVKISRTIYRGVSPSTTRLESRVRELEDLLDLERDARVRAERHAADLGFQVDALSERLDEAGGSTTQTQELLKRREMEINKLRKDLENANASLELAETSMRRRHQTALNELALEVENLQKQKGKAEKDKSHLIMEQSAESKLEGLDSQLNRLKSLTDDLQRQLTELNNAKSRLTSENFELLHINQDYEAQILNYSKAKSSLESQVDDLKRSLDDEAKMRITSAAAAAAAASASVGLNIHKGKNKVLKYNTENTNSLTPDGKILEDVESLTSLGCIIDDQERSDTDVKNRFNLQAQLTSLQMDYDNLQAKYDEESEEASNLRGQVSKFNADIAALKSKFERELMSKTEEFEEMKRKLTMRITELEDTAERERLKAVSLEKLKTKLTLEIKDLQSEIESLSLENGELIRRAKAAESLASELQRRVDELTIEVNTLTSQNSQLEDQVKELKSSLRDANRRLTDLEALRSQLEAERDNLASALHDAEEALHDMDQKYQASQAALNHLKSEMEQRLRERDEELESLRKSTTRTIEELTVTITEMEVKYKSELSRLKKRYESNIAELEIQLDTANKANANLMKENKNLSQRVKDLETYLDEERRLREAAENNLQVCKSKCLRCIYIQFYIITYLLTYLLTLVTPNGA
ncbi:unnamed protein product [Schistosoma curassoni]|uniref:Paramyosin n=1 Tax=Schistosoma curassoni TaxID=6186 RepID=A0A183K544_9TREM|nr:unnamed protein product [Schistosoma curassoni]